MGGASSAKNNLPTHPVDEAPVFESYRVRPEIFTDIVRRLGNKKPQIDLFADQHNKLCERFYSVEDDSFTKDWGSEKFIWCNPPYSMMGLVVEKSKTDGARGILIAPDWQTRERWEQIKKLVQKSIFSDWNEAF